MKTILLTDEIHKELHVLTASEWAKMGNKHKSFNNSDVWAAFLPGYGTTLFFENIHFLIVPDNKPLKTFAIWRNHNVIGYCDITQEVADKANEASNARFYYGFDSVTNPEKY